MHRVAADLAAGGPIMAHQDYVWPVPRITDLPPGMVAATAKFENLALRWRTLAERRCAHFIDLYKSGRWQRYYDEPQFLAAMQAAEALAVRWMKIAPLPNEHAEVETIAPETSSLEAAIDAAFAQVTFAKATFELAPNSNKPKFKRVHEADAKHIEASI